MKWSRCVSVMAALVLAVTSAAHAEIVTFGIGINQFNMEFVEIGSPGNAADTTGMPNPAGSVAYQYGMGKFEVSEDMIEKATAGGLSGVRTSEYGPDKPARYLSWFEAARCVNWLNTTKGFHQAYKFDGGGNFQPWQSNDDGYDSSNLFRNRLANFVLPSMDEWYKAAYYDPNANNGAGGYWDFPTGSNAAPTAVASGTGAGTAVYNGQAGPANITQAGGLSPFKTMGQGGNADEWVETEYDLINDGVYATRVIRGGAWNPSASEMSSSVRRGVGPSPEDGGPWFGFRVASLSSVPEPSSLVLWSLFGLIGGFVAWRKRKR